MVVGHKQGEARMYQFSREDQDAVCVDLDGKRPAEHLPRRQPAGFQCILQCTHHAATISSVAISSKAKLLALADEAGCVSLVDLSRVRTQSVSALQCIMQCNHYAATISGMAVASTTKLLALADEAGCVSLVALSRMSMQFVVCAPMPSAIHSQCNHQQLSAKLSCLLWLGKRGSVVLRDLG